MDHLSTFFAMGGYAAFVWPAYGVAALVLVLFAIDSWRRVKVAEAALRRFESQQPVGARRMTAASPRAATQEDRRAQEGSVQEAGAQEDGAVR